MPNLTFSPPSFSSIASSSTMFRKTCGGRISTGVKTQFRRDEGIRSGY
jgi:hypothetical protein